MFIRPRYKPEDVKSGQRLAKVMYTLFLAGLLAGLILDIIVNHC